MSLFSHAPTRLAAGVAATAALAIGVMANAGGAGAATGRPATDVMVAKDHTITMVTNLHPGRAQFVVRGMGTSGGGPHEAQLLRTKNPGLYGKNRLIADVKSLNESGRGIALEAHFTAVGGADIGHTFWTELTPGKYYMVDVDAPAGGLTAAMIHTIYVSGSYRDATLPQVHPTISAIHEMTWASTPSTIARIGAYHFDNASTDTHFVVLAQMKPGKTDSDITKVFQGKEGFGDVFTGVTDESGIVSAGHQMTVTYALPAGTYGLLCFWPDDETGQPHSAMGMHRTIQLH